MGLLDKIKFLKEEATRRLDICNSCDKLRDNNTCKECGCYMPAKTHLPFTKCPLNKWNRTNSVYDSDEIISISVFYPIEKDKSSCEFFWKRFKSIYNEKAYDKFTAIIINDNIFNEPVIDWNKEYHYNTSPTYTTVIKKDNTFIEKSIKNSVLNFPIAIRNILNEFEDNQIIEILDSKMFHIKQQPKIEINNDEVYVSTFYEELFLYSKTTNKNVMDAFNVSEGYNGGFLPIICNVYTLKRIISEWISYTIEILNGVFSDEIYQLAPIYSFNIACAKNNIKMISKDYLYVSDVTNNSESQYISYF